MANHDCYEILGIDKSANVTEIRKAFRRKVLKAHPDHGGSSKKFIKLKKALDEALGALKPIQVIFQNPSSETSYDYYDPFNDPHYFGHEFFEPENPNIASFERRAHARGCKYCKGIGTISKLVNPSLGFMGREERFCICQQIKVKT